jgi:hypothetical protein
MSPPSCVGLPPSIRETDGAREAGGKSKQSGGATGIRTRLDITASERHPNCAGPGVFFLRTQTFLSLGSTTSGFQMDRKVAGTYRIDPSLLMEHLSASMSSL